MSDENDDIINKAKNSALRLISGNDYSPKGMGDVQAIDQDKSMGYQDPNQEIIAQQLHQSGVNMASQFPNLAQNITPHDVSTTQNALSGGMSAGTTYGTGNGLGISLSKEEQVLDTIKNIPRTAENMPQIKALLQSIYGKVKLNP